jgi:hypothetical protein
MNIKPIETEYKGYKFRSRLEARWAVFFDAMNVNWYYEPEGFHLPNGLDYLPDFYLPDHDIWVEVKGVFTDEDADKVNTFYSADTENQMLHNIIVVGEFPPEVDDVVQWAYDKCGGKGIYMNGFLDFPYLPCVCPTCGKFGFEFDGRGARICRHDDNDKGYSADHPSIKIAYGMARQARFEHGETPIIGRVIS